MIEFFESIFRNKILVATLVSFVTAQILKAIIVLIREKRFDLHRLFGGGGMPSSHSALVTALAVSVGRYCRIDSPEFAISAAFAVIVMYDASNVRRAAGEQAKILNFMMAHWGESTPNVVGRQLKELLGHTPLEVLAGSALGAIIAFLF